MKRRNFLAGMFAPLVAMLPWQKAQDCRRTKLKEILYGMQRRPRGKVLRPGLRIAQPQDVFTIATDIGVHFQMTYGTDLHGNSHITVRRFFVPKRGGVLRGFESATCECPDVNVRQPTFPESVFWELANWLIRTMSLEERTTFFLLLKKRGCLTPATAHWPPIRTLLRRSSGEVTSITL